MESAWAVLTHPLVLVTAGGAVGSLLRFVVGRWVDARFTAGGLPWGTFTVNVAGSFILGVLALWVLERLPAEYRGVYLLLGTGFCGGFTTFSTFSYEAARLLEDGSVGRAAAYMLASVLFSLAAVFAGFALARVMLAPAR
jgi:CrcB protein